jgi:hypothetical protein
VSVAQQGPAAPPEDEAAVARAKFMQNTEAMLARALRPFEASGVLTHRRFKEIVKRLAAKVATKEEEKARVVATLPSHVPRRNPWRFDRKVGERVAALGVQYMREHPTG